ncbi:hypothetical protein EG329_004028 [Mollisiaceae sp. DMI_Dod_QoI]|nr:hypothetical protein EG329_004028 [Helotiales sp. DMI_Dod_QoI]
MQSNRSLHQNPPNGQIPPPFTDSERKLQYTVSQIVAVHRAVVERIRPVPGFIPSDEVSSRNREDLAASMSNIEAIVGNIRAEMGNLVNAREQSQSSVQNGLPAQQEAPPAIPLSVSRTDNQGPPNLQTQVGQSEQQPVAAPKIEKPESVPGVVGLDAPEKRGRGRPKGSKNKPKVVPSAPASSIHFDHEPSTGEEAKNRDELMRRRREERLNYLRAESEKSRQPQPTKQEGLERFLTTHLQARNRKAGEGGLPQSLIAAANHAVLGIGKNRIDSAQRPQRTSNDHLPPETRRAQMLGRPDPYEEWCRVNHELNMERTGIQQALQERERRRQLGLPSVQPEPDSIRQADRLRELKELKTNLEKDPIRLDNENARPGSQHRPEPSVSNRPGGPPPQKHRTEMDCVPPIEPQLDPPLPSPPLPSPPLLDLPLLDLGEPNDDLEPSFCVPDEELNESDILFYTCPEN